MVERHFTTGCKTRGSPSTLDTAKVGSVTFFIEIYKKMTISFEFRKFSYKFDKAEKEFLDTMKEK